VNLNWNPVKLIVTSAAAAFLVVMGTPTASMADETASVEITVTPSSGLSDGQIVTVSATGFVPGETVIVGECAVPGKQWSCDPDAGTTATADHNGTVTVTGPVHASFDGVNPADGSAAGAVDCKTVADGCWIGVASTDMERGANMGISFD
jgi:hypothetical protein